MKFYIFQDSLNQYRWKLLAGNGRSVAVSGEGYYNKQDCLAGIYLVMDTSRSTPVEDQTVSAASRW
jgi:uncharacterized protein